MVDRLTSTIGLGDIRAFHLNDAKADLGSHLDRHENIGKGMIGTSGFVPVLSDPRWAAVAGYLESPIGEDGYGAYARDLMTLRGALAPSPKKPASKGRAAPRARRAA